MLHKTETLKSGISIIQGSQVCCLRAKQQQVSINIEDGVLQPRYMCNTSVGSADSEVQISHEGSKWEVVSLEDALDILDRRDEKVFVNDFICILQKCRIRKDLVFAKRVLAHIQNSGLEDHTSIGNHIVPVFVDCGSLPDAQQVFNRLVHRNAHSWTSLILGYALCGHSQHALNLYQKMQEDKVFPSSYTLVAVLKACASLKDVREIHNEVVQKQLEGDVFVGSTLVDTYIKCGSVSEAQEVFDKLPTRNIVSWNALITGYAVQGSGQQALDCFQRMKFEDVCPDDITFVCILKACGSMGIIERGQKMHIEITQRGFERYLPIGNTLVDMYAKCGFISEAQQVFDKLLVRSVVSWNALIGGYAEYGHGQEALKSFEQMQMEGVFQNFITFISALKACSTMAAIDKAREIHMEIIGKGFEGDLVLGSTLSDMYAKCGLLSEARHVFDKMSERPVVSWNALIAGYADYGPIKEALDCFDQMQLQGVSSNAITFVSSLKACGSIGALDKGLEIHKEIAMKGVDRDLFVGSTLVDMYAKCGSFADAQHVVDKLPGRNIVSWTALIAGQAEYGLDQEALICFEEMKLQGISPNAAMYACFLKASNNKRSIELGRALHREITMKAFEKDPPVGNTLVDMYAKCGSLAEAQHVFHKLPGCDVVSWNALIAGYAEHGPLQGVLECFEKMESQGVGPNDVTFASAVKACISIGSIGRGREIHAGIVHNGFEKDICLGSSLVDMYAKCGSLAEAQQVFDNLLARNIVSWTLLISGYAEHGLGQEALSCFEQMELQYLSPNTAIFASVLKACGSIGSINRGQEIHRKITVRGFEQDLFIGNALIDMYGKCSSLGDACKVFESLPVRDIVSWNAMIMGYGTNHKGSMAVQLFESMQEEGVKPNEITFACLLNACSHASLVGKGEELFKEMKEKYGIVPRIDHFSCMVDLFARSGHLSEAKRFLETMPCSPSQDMWAVLLSACKTHAEAELGLRCFKQLVKINPEFAAPYILMTNIYVSAGKLDEGFKIEKLRKNAGAVKKPGSASIEVNKEMHEFVVGNIESKELSTVLKMLTSRMEEHGYVPDTDVALKYIFAEATKFKYVQVPHCRYM